MAELPKDKPTVSSAFLFPGYSQERIMKWDHQKVPIWSLQGAYATLEVFLAFKND
jgi:hypothetical protein